MVNKRREGINMIKLFSLKQQKKDDPGAGGARSNPGHKQATAAQLRITKGKMEFCSHLIYDRVRPHAIT